MKGATVGNDQLSPSSAFEGSRQRRGERLLLRRRLLERDGVLWTILLGALGRIQKLVGHVIFLDVGESLVVELEDLWADQIALAVALTPGGVDAHLRHQSFTSQKPRASGVKLSAL